jgi:hypothetical protein
MRVLRAQVRETAPLKTADSNYAYGMAVFLTILHWRQTAAIGFSITANRYPFWPTLVGFPYTESRPLRDLSGESNRVGVDRGEVSGALGGPAGPTDASQISCRHGCLTGGRSNSANV